MADHESHHARIPVLRGIGNQPEAADHVATHHIVQCTAWSGRPLLVQNLEIITMERGSPGACAIALRGCLGDELAKGAGLFALRGRPIQAVLFSLLANDALRIGFYASASPILFGVLVLCVNISKTGLNRVQLILANAAEQNL